MLLQIQRAGPPIVPLPSHQPVNPPAQRFHRLQNGRCRIRRNETPSDCNPHPRSRFIQRPQCRLEPKPRIAPAITEPLR